MKRLLAALAALVGLALIAVGAVVAVLLGGGRASSSAVVGWAVVIFLFALAAALWKVRGRLDETSDSPVPWASGDDFANPAPEKTDDEFPLSSEDFAGEIQEAASRARTEGTVAVGIEEIRPSLRRTLLAALEQGHWDRSEAVEAMKTGEWTDDQVAASVLDPDVLPPRRSLLARIEAWLYPERVVRRRTGRAMQAVAEAADDALSTVPGQTAPRTVPVLKPRLSELRRGADGDLRRALDPDAVARGPDPPDPTSDPEEGSTDEEVSEA